MAVGGSPGMTLPDTIQTSASINPGNSGGALVDLAGQVIGIPILAAADQQIGGVAPGIGFANSSNIVTDIAGQIVAHGKVIHSHRAALGVEVTTVAGARRQPAGAGIVSVQPDGAAAAAALKAGDVIVDVTARQPRAHRPWPRYWLTSRPVGTSRSRWPNPAETPRPSASRSAPCPDERPPLPRWFRKVSQLS